MRPVLLIICCAGTLLIGALAGCALTGKTTTTRYYGPTQTMAEVVGEINDNNRLLPTMRATLDYEANIVDVQNHDSHFISGDGVMQFRKPRDLRLILNKPPLGRAFDVGSNAERYWVMQLLPDDQRKWWWGNYRNVGKPCVGEIPLRPDALIEVLGINDINTNFNELPAPTMRFNNDADAYMFTWNTRSAEHWWVEKEVWYDRKTKLPSVVLLFDVNGRIVVRAYLKKHAAVTVEGAPAGGGPKVARQYDLFFPDSRSTMRIDVKDLARTYETDDIIYPNDASFRFPRQDQVSVPSGSVIQVDRDCEK